VSGDADRYSSWLEEWRRAEQPLAPFHWEIEFPEVFDRENGGFDCFAGNPPFLGGSRISEVASGPVYQHWLKAVVAPSKGQVDLCVFFFHRAFSLLRAGGAFGLLATSAISFGDNRVAGLAQILLQGGTILSATTKTRWPGEAAVLVSIVHVGFGNPSLFGGVRDLNGTPCRVINSRLQASEEVGDPLVLASNEGLAHIGTSMGGRGFVLDKNEASQLLGAPENPTVILPLTGGEEVNAPPSAQNDRFAISFGSRTLDEAGRWPELLELVRERVLPQRMKGRDHGPGNHGKKFWWQHVLRADPLYAAIAGLKRCLVTARVSTHHALRFESTQRLFNEKVFVFAFDDHAAFSILQSDVHQIWSSENSSRLGAVVNYSVSKTFATFPFPDLQTRAALAAAGQNYYDFRADLMVRTDEGLTKVYNRFHDPDSVEPEVLMLRELHCAMDRAVLDAYRWGDVPTDCEFLLEYELDEEEPGDRKKPYRYRWPDDVRSEVLARLFELNAEQARAEIRSGNSVSKEAGKTREKSASTAPQTEELF
jgi:hypothetical protein